MEETSPKGDRPVIRMEDVAVGSLQDLSVTVAEEVNWLVQPGDYWVIAGLQGAGKTDFLMMTGGVMAPLRGRYWLFEQEMPIFDEARLKERLRLGLVFESGQLFNQLTVRENLALPFRYHLNLAPAQAAAEIEVFLDAMELGPWADSTPGAIGRNWQKRVGLARALTLRPEVLLIDNPLAGLDLRHAKWWLGFLNQLSKGHRLLQERPVTLAVSTADLRLWKDQARQFAILRNKRLTALGTWAQLEAASEELVRELLPAELPSG